MTNQPSKTITLTVGTAGHIDHGKTELVKFLTGCNTDCLPEEQRRGMTIDLGFATCELPDRRRVGIVDVPGHERFIHNMVAGAAGIDVVILVVAADDGVMPQTIEHFHIVRMLGVDSGMVVITKSDLADETRIGEVEQQVRTLTAGSFLDGSPIVPFSSKTGAGFDLFHKTFLDTVDTTSERNSDGAFRLHIERAFALKGLGTIVSGIPASGSVREGDALELLPGGEKKRVKGIQVYGAAAQQAQAGECVALRMGDIAKSHPTRGMVLTEPGFFVSSQFINARFHFLPHVGKPLQPRTAIRFHIGTTDVPGHMVLPELKPLRPGNETYVQFQLKRPVVAAPGDFYVVRLLSPVTTIGGGYVVAPVTSKMRRTRGNWVEECERREEAFATPETAIAYVLEHSDPVPMTLRQLAHQSFKTEDAAARHVANLVKTGRVVELPGKRYVHSSVLTDASAEITTILDRFHDANPISIGFPKKEVLRELHADRLVVEKAFESLAGEGIVSTCDAGMRLAKRIPELTPRQTRTAERIEAVFLENPFLTPRADQLPEILGMPAPLIKPVMAHLLQKGVLVDCGENIVFHRDHVRTARDRMVEYVGANKQIEPGAFRDLLGTTRKYSIPLLEHFDRTGVTIRKGNARVLRQGHVL